LDIGVGTGYYLGKLNLNPNQQQLGLLDLNNNCLKYAKNKLKHLQPEIYQHSVFEPFTSITKKYNSASLNYVLHCLPGTIQQKAIAFDHIKAILNPSGKLFGTTLLGKGSNRNWLARKFLKIYNHKKIMNNHNDDYNTLFTELKSLS